MRPDHRSLVATLVPSGTRVVGHLRGAPPKVGGLIRAERSEGKRITDELVLSPDPYTPEKPVTVRVQKSLRRWGCWS